jgi:5'-3' exonuclease
VAPKLIPDFLALVGDKADGFPGIPGIGKFSASRLLNKYGAIEKFPGDILGEKHKEAILFKQLATLKTDAPVFKKVSELKWHGPNPKFAEFTAKAGEPRLLVRAKALQQNLSRQAPPSTA